MCCPVVGGTTRALGLHGVESWRLMFKKAKSAVVGQAEEISIREEHVVLSYATMCVRSRSTPYQQLRVPIFSSFCFFFVAFLG